MSLLTPNRIQNTKRVTKGSKKRIPSEQLFADFEAASLELGRVNAHREFMRPSDVRKALNAFNRTKRALVNRLKRLEPRVITLTFR